MTEPKEDTLVRLKARLAEVTQECRATEAKVFAHQDTPRLDRGAHSREAWRLHHMLSHYQAHQHNLECAVEMQEADPAKAISYTADGLIVIQVSTDDWLTDLERQNGSKACLIKAYQETVDMSYQLFQLSLQFALPDGETVSPTDFEPLTAPDGAEPLSFA